MKMFSKLASLVIALVASTTTSLAIATPIIILTGGTIAPGSTFSLDFKTLPIDVSYQIKCTINSPEATNLNFSLPNGAKWKLHPWATVNGNFIGDLGSEGGANSAINQGNNNLVVSSLDHIQHTTDQPESIAVKNLDNSTTVTLSSCFAVPS
jgi:hypothetical protein